MPNVAAIDFYRMEMPGGSEIEVKFEDLLKRTIDLQESVRTKIVNGFPVRLQSLRESENFRGSKIIEGELIRIKMSGLPKVAGVSGGIEDLNIEDDKGLGSETVFMYHPATKVLVIHAVQTGVSIASFLKYFEQVGETELQIISGSISADPLINSDTYMRLVRIAEVSSFSFRVAAVDNESFLKDVPKSIKQEISLLSKFSAPSIEISVTRGRIKKDSIDATESKNAIKSLLDLRKKHKESVQNIRISGKSSENETIQIKNLLKDIIKEDIKINEQGLRVIPYNMRRDAVREAWTRRKEEIFSMFKVDS